MNKSALSEIQKDVISIMQTLPPGVLLVAAVKTRTPEEIKAAIHGGIHIIGHNYVQEAALIKGTVTDPVKWHMIGHLQRNKVKMAVQIFDMIETIDSVRLAKEVNRQCDKLNKMMPVLIEVNSGKESNKTGVLPENVVSLIEQINLLPNLQIQGLMTMGPRFGNPEDARPYFKATRAVFEQIKKLKIPHIEMRYLSMGMSNSYKIAIEEGANMVRIGTRLFGARNP
ncbi:MAG: YggS family pyridoxal phosphate-dependent enzyme [Prolixibacteraceae bacterium]|nr:YggS family pyridoxal phosphate-dependent enzyme [Prolixibacteraceae bacterium]